MSSSDEVDVPPDPFSISAEWLATALPPAVLGGATVIGVDISDIGSGTGIFGELARVELRTSGGDGSAPSSIVAKMACTEPANLEVAKMLGIYERELTFFEQIAPSTSLRVPRCHLSRRSDDGRFVLLMEDMSTDYDVGDQVAGATVEQAEMIIDELVMFHAHWWEHPELDEMHWVPVPNAPAYVAAVPGIYRAGLPVLRADWADRVSTEAIDLATKVEPHFEDLLQRTATGPTTLIHTDTRLDNIFFAKPGAAVERPIAFIDFQLILRGRGVADVAYLIGTSIEREAARSSWDTLLRRWHDGITASTTADGSAIDYPWDDCVQHYREAALYYLSGAMSLIGTFDAGNERGAALVHAYSSRILEHVVDIDAEQVLPPTS